MADCRLCNAGLDNDTKRKIDELHEDNKENKKARSQIYLSAIGPTEFATMGSKAGLTYRNAVLPLMGKKEGTAGFGWDDRLEKAQADRYSPKLAYPRLLVSYSCAYSEHEYKNHE